MFFERTFKQNFEKLTIWNRVQLFLNQKSAKTIATALYVTSLKINIYIHGKRLRHYRELVYPKGLDTF